MSHMMCTLPADALVVSFDTKWEARELIEHVLEIGVTKLDIGHDRHHSHPILT
jgi:hypothetical protein